ncbi:serine-rich adhesin for platelets isoform X3 [Drosophila guanche]|uniref:Blast:Ribokinase n=2 Tax=Drosophila guanche TaxID=7266 RepID=A0A3B0JWU2_DROGU|nr:serine-rich adhesin for platelets isoform X3 [Drosophila guanche]SPP78209.1 blast:Ribokinase [Drosophila guanche]
MNNEQKPASPDTSLSSTTQPSTTSLANAFRERSAERLAAAANSKIPSIILHTPIVSIASGTMSKSTTTTTSTKTTPTAHRSDGLFEAMANNLTTLDSAIVRRDDGSVGVRGPKKTAAANAKSTSKSVADSDKRKSYSPPNSVSNSNNNSHNNPSVSGSEGTTIPISSLTASVPEVQTVTSSNKTTQEEPGAATVTATAAAAGAPLPQVYSFLDETPKLEGPTRRCLQYGGGAKGKTQDDQNVGKRQKNKKTKYDAWEDSDFNDLDDASLKKLLEEAYWYRNPGDRKNKSERFLQMLKKAEYDEEISYRAIKTCLTLNPITLATSASTSGAAGISINSNSNSNTHHTNNRSGERHKQGGSLQDLVEAAHRSGAATTSAAAAAAAASATSATTQRFNCDYQLSGRANRRHQQQHNNNNQNAPSASKKIKNWSVSGRQREGGSLPSSVNFEPATTSMDAKLKQTMADSSQSQAAAGKRSTGSGSCSSLPSHLGEAEAGTQFDMDEDETGGGASGSASAAPGPGPIQQEYLLELEGDNRVIQKKKPVANQSANSSMSHLSTKALDNIMQSYSPQQPDSKDSATGSEYRIGETMPFLGPVGVRPPGTAHIHLHQQHIPLQQQDPAGIKYERGAEDRTRKVDAGYVSLSDSYTACSSVYGDTSTASHVSSRASTSSEVFGKKGGRAGPVAMGAKSTSRNLDENGNALSDGYGTNGTPSSSSSGSSSSGGSSSNQFTALVTTTMGANAPASSSSTSRQSSVSTLLTTGSNTTTTAMAAAAVAASFNSQLQQVNVGNGSGGNGAASCAATGAGTVSVVSAGTGAQPTKPKSKKRSQQERNSTTVVAQSVAGYRGQESVEQLVKYIENDGNSGGQRKKERKKQSQKLKKSNSLEELRSCSKMEADDLKRESATTEMMPQKKDSNSGNASGSGKHNSASVADISKNFSKEQQQATAVQVQVRGPAAGQQRKGERRSWGTEELQYLGDQDYRKPGLGKAAARSEPDIEAESMPLSLPALSCMSEMDALNTVLSETAEFHVVTKKKKPKKQRAVTMDDAAVAAAAHAGGNLQRMQQITKSASSNMMSQRTHYYTAYTNSGASSNTASGSNHHGQYPSKLAQQQQPQYQEAQPQHHHHHHHHYHHHHHHGGSGSPTKDSSRRKSTSSMPPSEKSDSSDLDSVHSLPIQTVKKKSGSGSTGGTTSNKERAAQAATQRQVKKKTLAPAPISYADIARNKREALKNASNNGGSANVSDPEPSESAADKPPSGGGGGKGSKSKIKPDFPELPVALSIPVAISSSSSSGSTVTNQVASSSNNSSSAGSISYSKSLNATPASSTSDVDVSPELTPTCTTAPSSSLSSSQPSLQKSKSVEHDASYSFNSSNLDQQYPALEKTVKRHSTTNVSLTAAACPASGSGSGSGCPAAGTAASTIFNFAAATKLQMVDKSTGTTSLPTTSAKSKTKSKDLSYSSASSSSSSSGSSSSKKSMKLGQDEAASVAVLVLVPAPVAQKSTTATQTEGSKKMGHKMSHISSKLAPELIAGRPAVIILNDDRDSAEEGLNNEFIFGDFNEDELKLFDDKKDEKERGNDKDKEQSEKKVQAESQSKLQSEPKPKVKPQAEAQPQSKAQEKPQPQSKPEPIDMEQEEDEATPELEQIVEEKAAKKEEENPTGTQSDTSSSSYQQLIMNDSGAASDVVNSSVSLDMLSISGEAVQSSSPHSAAISTNSGSSSIINSSTSSTPSSDSAPNSNSSSSVSISSSAGGNGPTGHGLCSRQRSGAAYVANQSSDSGIYGAANTSVKDHINQFLSRASSSSEEPLPNAPISMQQLETCNDIEAAIIAAARAAAAARSNSCSRRNSQELEPSKSHNQQQQQHQSPVAKTKAAPVYTTYNVGSEDYDEDLEELSFLADLRDAEVHVEEEAEVKSETEAESVAASPTQIDPIVEYISSTWHAISTSKHVMFYREPEQEI